jgi:hypothetical protein
MPRQLCESRTSSRTTETGCDILGGIHWVFNERLCNTACEECCWCAVFRIGRSLVSSIGVYHGAEALEILLGKSAVDKTQVPPAGKLRPLLKALEPRCTSLRFLDSVVYCRNLLVQYSKSADSKTFWKVAIQVPDADGIAKLVLALSKLQQSGPRSKLELKAASTAPWVIAFSSWVLGFFPSITFDHGQPLLASLQNSRIEVVALEILGEDLEISFSSDLGRPSDLIVCQGSGLTWSGMVSVTTYGQSLREEFDLSSDDAMRCLTDILPHAIHQCLTLLRPSIDTRSEIESCLRQPTSPDYKYFTFDESLSSLSANPLGQDANISKAISLIFGISSEKPRIGAKPFVDVMYFHNLPALQHHLAVLEGNCKCTWCNQTRSRSRSFRPCLKENFWHGIASVVTDILCLSLFENLDELAVSLHQDRDTRAELSSGVVFDVLTRGTPQPYSVVKFYDLALALVGYSESERLWVKNLSPFPPRRILSSVKGQVTYLELFETRSVARRGYMTLAWARGQLRSEDVEYPAAVASTGQFFVGGSLNQSRNGAVVCPRNLYSNYSMEWVSRPTGEGLLELRAVCRGSDCSANNVHVNAFHILENLAQPLIMEVCEHNSDTPLNEPDMETRYTGPLFSHSYQGLNDHTSITCAAVAGDNGLRLLTFGSQAPPFLMVFRGGACLACALAVCQKANSRLLIL